MSGLRFTEIKRPPAPMVGPRYRVGPHQVWIPVCGGRRSSVYITFGGELEAMGTVRVEGTEQRLAAFLTRFEDGLVSPLTRLDDQEDGS